MTVKSYIISLSVAGAAAAVGCWIFLEPAKPEAVPGPSPVAKAQASSQTHRAFASTKPSTAAKAAQKTGRSSAATKTAPAPVAVPAPVENLTPEVRAAKVEQEANHELRRLVTLLNLDDQQQDKVFDTLVRGSRYWSPEMQVANPAASASGKRTRQTEAFAGSALIGGTATETPTTPGTASTGTSATSATTGGSSTTPAVSDSKVSDPMSEIMGLLTPEQQTVLIESEMDRTAWWAEILPQIMPEETPALDGSGSGTKEYEGSNTLE